MKRTKIDILEIADYNNLQEAVYLAAKGKKYKNDKVNNFLKHSERKIRELRGDILSLKAPYGRFTQFTIKDPKVRTIHAACFEDRVLHHAIMKFVGPVLVKSMVTKSYACIKGRGTHKALSEVLKNIRKYPWYVKIDIRKYFDTIDHELLFGVIERKIKGGEVHEILKKIIDGYSTFKTGKGIPIGSLTSQYFANYYLDLVDRFVMEQLKVKAYVRYMDDIIWWSMDKKTAKQNLTNVIEYLKLKRNLEVKEYPLINRSIQGVTYCGTRVTPVGFRLTRRKKRNYLKNIKKWEDRWVKGEIDDNNLQQAYEAVHSSLAHINSLAWRKAHIESLYH